MNVTATADPPADREWLHRAGLPGRRSFRLAAAATVGAAGAGVLAWGALAWLVSTQAPAAAARSDPGPALAVLALAILVRAAAAHLARRRATQGRTAVARQLRNGLLATILPDRPPQVVAAGAAAAHNLLELTDAVATFHERATPARSAAAAASGVVLVVVAVVHWPAAVLLALSTPILPVNMRVVGRATEALDRAQLDAVRLLSTQLLDRFAGMHVLRTLGAVSRERTAVRRACDELNRATMAVLRRAFVTTAVIDVVVTFAIAITATYVGLTLLGYLRLPGVPALDLYAGLFVLLLAPAYFAPMKDVAAGYHERDGALAATAILRPSLDANPADAAGPVPPDASSARRPVSLRHAPRIELAAVTVRHADAGTAVLDDITATVAPGRITVLSAPSGAGKSTLLELVGGLREPTSGVVRWHDPVTGRAGPPELGRASWLGQRAAIVPGTIGANIALGDPRATSRTVVRAAVQVGLGALLARLPDGLDTMVGDRGWGLSAGEARRVGLARTLLRDAALWILDEPTAHLDAETEAEIVAVLVRASAGRTVLIASHSPAVVAQADIRWRLDEGRLLEADHGTIR